jgi:hypothetical protein
LSVASSGNGVGQSTSAVMRRRSLDVSHTKSPAENSTPGEQASVPNAINETLQDSSDLQCFTAFAQAGVCAGDDASGVASTFLQTTLGEGQLRGFTPVSPGEGQGFPSSRAQRRVSDVSFYEVSADGDVPTAEPRYMTTGRHRSLDDVRGTPAPGLGNTPLPLLLISTSPQPHPLAGVSLSQGRHLRTLEPVGTPARDAEMEDVDANVFRIRSLTSKTPADHYVVLSTPGSTSLSARATPKGRSYAIPSMPSASRSLSARSRDLFTHELELRVGSSTHSNTPSMATLGEDGSAHALLPELRAAACSVHSPRQTKMRSPRSQQ